MPDDSLPTEALLDGRYQLRECVGQGGMARVYRADDVLLGRTVAVKLLRSEMDGASSSGRARGEMTVLASLNHPALVTLYDAQLIPGRAEYLVMEFVDGPTLSARVAQGAMPSEEAAVLAADLADALHVVHGAGIVHRDIKPSNVLMSGRTLAANRSGAKLADFGISVLVDAARLTSPGLVIGTAAYIAPEQMKGAPPAPPADIYSLGLVLLEALTGRRAFADAEGIGAAMARLIETPEVPEHLGSGWSSLLRGMLAAEPGERPTAAAVFAAASELAKSPAAHVPPTVPAAVAAAGPAAPAVPAAVAAGGPAGAATAPVLAASSTAAEDTPTRVLSDANAAPSAASAAARSTPSRRRRLGILTGVAAAAVAASVAAGALLTGGGAPDPQVTNPVDTEQSPAPSATPVDIAPADNAPIDPVEDTEPGEQSDPPSEDERKAAEEAAKNAEREQKKAEQEQKKAEQEQKKAEEEAQKNEETVPTEAPTPEPSAEVEQ